METKELVLIECESCPEKVKPGSISAIKTNRGTMRLCPKCTAAHYSGKELAAKEVENLTSTIAPVTQSDSIQSEVHIPITTKTENPDAMKYLEGISLVTGDKDSMVDPEATDKRITLPELFARASRKGQFIVEQCAINGEWNEESYKKLETYISLIEAITYENKAVGAELHKKKRLYEASTGKNRWDKERRGENTSNGKADPRDSAILKEAKKKKAALTKVEVFVKGMMEIGTEENDIFEMGVASGKFKGSEIREAIERMKE